MYESFYLRAVDPVHPRCVWIRSTVHKAPGSPATGSVWCTVFDSTRDAPYAVKQTFDLPTVPGDGWIVIGESTFGPSRVQGAASGADRSASWDLAVESHGPGLRHLPKAWMYRAPLPRTKLESPMPAARFTGTVSTDDATIQLDGWPGMVGHNWGAEHAATWIWLHGTLFEGAPDAWMDVALGRVRVGPVLTPWIANGAMSVEGNVTRLGGLRRAHVEATPAGCRIEIAGATIEARSPADQTVAWIYADPGGAQHHVLNCSIAEVRVKLTGSRGTARSLMTPHGGAYELGTAETSHGVPVQPFSDG
jgi:hypothetical protein